ncbi:MAG: hypothetical protein J6A75_05900 [Lachnospiraceae bacterium]|nr:hypothetical protein [Lachnospiraceae bacterium]
MERYKLQKCALCGLEKEIQLSHIIPKFIGKHLKKTSIGSIRSAENPNIVIQDLEKHYLLCRDCEEEFSARENWFARNIFYLWKKEETIEFEYDSNLNYFIISLSWRSLYLDIMNYVQEGNVEIEKFQIMIDAEKMMRKFLLGKDEDLGNIENHIFFFERVESVNDDKFLLNPNTTIHRSTVSYTHYTEDTVFTVSNLMGIIIVTMYEKGYREEWKGTKIDRNRGKIIAANQNVKSVVCGEFQYWMEEADKQMERMSETQKAKIVQKMKAIGEDIKKYDIYQDFLDDQNIKKNSSI